MTSALIRIAIATGVAITLAPAMAKPPTGPNCTASIVTDNTNFNPSYVSCSGSVAGNLGEGTISFGGDSYTFIGKTSNDNTGSGPFQAFGVDFNAGTLTFDQAWTGTFILGLKAGNFSSLYKFSSITPVTSIAFDTLGVGVNGNGIGLGLSHANLYGGVAAVPEPETCAMLLVGLAALGFKARQRRA
jgi:hypothetical protein